MSLITIAIFRGFAKIAANPESGSWVIRNNHSHFLETSVPQYIGDLFLHSPSIPTNPCFS
jgi:hypothetical protein